MAKEKIEEREFAGEINVACKYEDGTVKYWKADKAIVVGRIIAIVEEYSKQGYVLTLRQLHYQMVTQNWIINHDTAYKKLGSILDDCRYGGLIDWDAIEDRGRTPFLPYWVRDVEHALKDTVDQYRVDRQHGQGNQIEVWTEKDALSGIFRQTTSEFHVQLIVNKGYTSSSAAYSAYERVVDCICAGRKFVILYFGDHDPSGLDMIRDIRERMMLFLTNGKKLQRGSDISDKIYEWWRRSGHYPEDLKLSVTTLKQLNKESPSCKALDKFDAARTRLYIEENELFQIIPIGLNMEQIKKYKLPPNPTKLNDPRADWYISKFGKSCWEVDALKPNVLTAIVEANISTRIDMKQFDKMVKLEEKGIKELNSIIKNRK